MAFNFSISSLSFLLLSIITVLIKFLTKLKSKHTKNLELIPGPPRLPIIGNLTQVRHMPHRTLCKLSRLYGPLMYLQLGQIPTLVISSSKLAQEVLKAQDLTFCTRPVQSKLRMIYYGGLDIAFTPSNEYWRQARRICYTELLTERRIQSFSFIREEEIGKLKENILRSSYTGLVNVSDALLCFVDGIMCRQLFGRRFIRNVDCGRSRFHHLIHEFALLMGHFNVGEYFPAMDCINSVTGLRRRSEMNFREIDELLEEVIEMHGGSGGETEECMAGVLLGLHKDPNGEILSRESIKGILMETRYCMRCTDYMPEVLDSGKLFQEALTRFFRQGDLFIAGTDPAFAALDWGMSELLKNPRIMNKLQEELMSVAGTKPKVEESDVPKLKYLKQVTREILRLHPPGPFLLPRESMNSCQLNGYEIPPKTRVVVNVWAIARDPSCWENPDEFCPERFDADVRDYRGQHFDLLPFGSGRRGCPGVSSSAVLLELALANIVHAFHWSLPDTNGLDLDMEEVYGIVVHRKSNLVLEASPRALSM